MADKGIFVTFEGSEGCGKSTQARLLADFFGRQGRRVVLTREPGGTAVGEQIRHILQHSKESGRMEPAAELLLFAASRAQLVREVIVPAREKGIDVISDRFFDSTIVYQGVARKLGEEEVEKINQFAVGGCIPDLTFILDLPAAEGRIRLLRRPRPAGHYDRIEEEPLDFFEQVREGYLRLAKADAARFFVLDASKNRQELGAAIAKRVSEKIHGI